MPVTIAVLKETHPLETRISAIPETIKKLVTMGVQVIVAKGAGDHSSYDDKDLKEAGADIAATNEAAITKADAVFCIRTPDAKTLSKAKKGTLIIGGLSPYAFEDKAFKDNGLTAFAMELMPRITRAQNMDILSSQSNLAGYQAVIEAAHSYNQAFPMMMTAAGTIAPAKCFVMGVGVAGLQAIATAKRLGASVSATDVRLATKEQVESLGAKFIFVDDDEAKQAETAGGYAKEMSEDYKAKQAELTAETIAKQDIVITTALIPGRPAPVLITEQMVKSMKDGSIIVDLATAMGGNCPLSEKDKIVVKHGVTIIGHTNMAGRISTDSSALFARNLFNFITLLYDPEKKKINLKKDEEITKAITLVENGKIVHDILGAKKPAAKKPKAQTKPKAKPKATKPSSKTKPAGSSKKKSTTTKKTTKAK